MFNISSTSGFQRYDSRALGCMFSIGEGQVSGCFISFLLIIKHSHLFSVSRTTRDPTFVSDAQPYVPS